MKKRTKFLLLGSGVTALMMALAESSRQALAGYFVRLALDRDVPPYPARVEHQLIGGGTSPSMLLEVQQAAAKLSAKPHNTVKIHSQDGTELLGHWMPVANPKRIIVAMHGWRSAWDNDFGLAADFFADNHCSVLYAEQRGQGRSGGNHMGFGLMERFDCLRWVDWVNEEMGDSPDVYLCGVSMGASTVLMAGGLDMPENVRGIIADCGYTSPKDIWRHVAKHLHVSYEICDKPVCKMAQQRLCMTMDAASCPQALGRCKVPVLFIHGTDDRFVPVEMTYENYKACAAPKRLFIVPGAEHGMSYLVDPNGYKQAVTNFWADCEEKTPS